MQEWRIVIVEAMRSKDASGQEQQTSGDVERGAHYHREQNSRIGYETTDANWGVGRQDQESKTDASSLGLIVAKHGRLIDVSSDGDEKRKASCFGF